MFLTIITHGVAVLVGGGLGWWIGKKGVANVKGDVAIAVQDVSKKV